MYDPGYVASLFGLNLITMDFFLFFLLFSSGWFELQGEMNAVLFRVSTPSTTYVHSTVRNKE